MSEFNEIQETPKRYAVIDGRALLDLFAMGDQEHFLQEHRYWVEAELQADAKKRKGLWSESIAVGSEGFVEKIRQQLGIRAKGRSVVSEKEGNALEEAQAPYSTLFEGKKEALRLDNSYFLDINVNNSMLQLGPTLGQKDIQSILRLLTIKNLLYKIQPFCKFI